MSARESWPANRYELECECGYEYEVNSEDDALDAKSIHEGEEGEHYVVIWRTL